MRADNIHLADDLELSVDNFLRKNNASVRTFNCLHYAIKNSYTNHLFYNPRLTEIFGHITMAKELLDIKESEFLMIPNFGLRSLNEIKEILLPYKKLPKNISSIKRTEHFKNIDGALQRIPG
jgi:DNA-directed RNA polymerase alpha subunit